jgi:TPR repeat protein
MELFTKLPCCNGTTMCIHCFRKQYRQQNQGESSEGFYRCGECMTKFPNGNEWACFWLHSLIQQRPHDNVHVRFLLGQMLNFDRQARIDEVCDKPYYHSWRPPRSLMEQAIFQPDRYTAVVHLKALADDHYYSPAILALADIYAIHYLNKPMAEHYYKKGVARETFFAPMGATRYGLFLQSEGRMSEAMEFLELAALGGHVVGQYEYAQCVLQSFRTEARSWSYRMLWGDEQKCQSLMEAIQYLCKAAENGFYPKANVLLARTLIETAEASGRLGGK